MHLWARNASSGPRNSLGGHHEHSEILGHFLPFLPFLPLALPDLLWQGFYVGRVLRPPLRGALRHFSTPLCCKHPFPLRITLEWHLGPLGSGNYFFPSSARFFLILPICLAIALIVRIRF